MMYCAVSQSVKPHPTAQQVFDQLPRALQVVWLALICPVGVLASDDAGMPAPGTAKASGSERAVNSSTSAMLEPLKAP